jgi:hypothetical protein
LHVCLGNHFTYTSSSSRDNSYLAGHSKEARQRCCRHYLDFRQTSRATAAQNAQITLRRKQCHHKKKPVQATTSDTSGWIMSNFSTADVGHQRRGSNVSCHTACRLCTQNSLALVPLLIIISSYGSVGHYQYVLRGALRTEVLFVCILPSFPSSSPALPTPLYNSLQGAACLFIC